LKRALPSATYLELAPAGHCPHHEAPAAVNSIIQTWVAAVEAQAATGAERGEGGAQQQQQQQQLEQLEQLERQLLRVGAVQEFVEADGEVITVSCIEGRPRNIFERWDAASWRLQRALNSVLGRGAQQQSPQQQA
jgi:hypothetical protein